MIDLSVLWWRSALEIRTSHEHWNLSPTIVAADCRIAAVYHFRGYLTIEHVAGKRGYENDSARFYRHHAGSASPGDYHRLAFGVFH